MIAERPETMVVENVLVTASNSKSKDAVYWLVASYAILQMLAFEHGATLVEYTPSELKKGATGNGRATKPLMVDTANYLMDLRLKRSQHNEADAILLGYLYLRRAKESLKKDGRV